MDRSGQVSDFFRRKRICSGQISDFFRRKRITPDRFGHTVYRRLGNGTRHEYTYEPMRQRLQEMKLFARVNAFKF
jgi:hypothetical protein